MILIIFGSYTVGNLQPIILYICVICCVVFSAVYSLAHVLTKELADATFADGATIVMDTAKYAAVILDEFTEMFSFATKATEWSKK